VVTQAIRDAGLSVVNCGKVPTPALAYYAQREDAATSKRRMPGIMVTGSHVPADRNGIKFYKQTGEVLKSDEAGILAAVKAVRTGEYAKDEPRSAFDADGKLKTAPEPAACSTRLKRPIFSATSGCFRRKAARRQARGRLPALGGWP
jgi:phosphomannomutase